jgi:hypothetical protein
MSRVSSLPKLMFIYGQEKVQYDLKKQELEKD